MKKKVKLPKNFGKMKSENKQKATLNDVLEQLKKLNEKPNVCPCYHLNQCPFPHYPPTPPYQPTWAGISATATCPRCGKYVDANCLNGAHVCNQAGGTYGTNSTYAL